MCALSGCPKLISIEHEAKPYVGIAAQDLLPSPSQCPYILQTGVFALSPLTQHAFQERVVGPIHAGAVRSYDGSDQGLVSSLVYAHHLFHEHEYMRLHPRYNTLARHLRHAEQSWGGQVKTVLVHHSRETRPWRLVPQTDLRLQNGTGSLAHSFRWARMCGAVHCGQLRAGYRLKASDAQDMASLAVNQQQSQVERAWSAFCRERTGSGRTGYSNGKGDNYSQPGMNSVR